jgi:hypothetical protein
MTPMIALGILGFLFFKAVGMASKAVVGSPEIRKAAGKGAMNVISRLLK